MEEARTAGSPSAWDGGFVAAGISNQRLPSVFGGGDQKGNESRHKAETFHEQVDNKKEAVTGIRLSQDKCVLVVGILLKHMKNNKKESVIENLLRSSCSRVHIETGAKGE